jgi:tRNA dimethylallyltransferase
MNPHAIRCVAIMGATATGKSDLAIAVALDVNGEVISMDSRQVYRGFDIGTAKVGRNDRARVTHHLIDILDPIEPSAAGRHAELAREAARAAAGRGHVPVFAGGTGLYFRALFHGLAPVRIPHDVQQRIRGTFTGRSTPSLYRELADVDPARAAQLSPNDRVRITRALEIIAHTGAPASEAIGRREPSVGEFEYLKIVLTMPRDRLHERVAQRTRALFDAGWVEEVARLREAGVPIDAPAMSGLGYAEIARAREREDLAGLLERVTIATRQFAKRQETFFRSERDAVWIDVTRADPRDGILTRVRAFLRGDGAGHAPQ